MRNESDTVWHNDDYWWCTKKSIIWFDEMIVNYDEPLSEKARILYDAKDLLNSLVPNDETIVGKRARIFGKLSWVMDRDYNWPGIIPFNPPYYAYHTSIPFEVVDEEIALLGASAATTAEALSFAATMLYKNGFDYFRDEVMWRGDLHQYNGHKITPGIYDSGGCRGLVVNFTQGEQFDPGECWEGLGPARYNAHMIRSFLVTKAAGGK